jgi:hypothetical protein
MTASIRIELAPDCGLDDINRQVAQGEMLGPLSGIGNNGAKTMLTFQSAAKPAKHAVITKDKAGKPDIPDGSKLVATGTIFIEGALVLCAASRPATAANQ